MRIQSGLSLINQQSQKQNKVAEQIAKLSSGKRINVAADDAAGLTISQKMQAQIRGLEQADENIKNGQSMIETIDKGIGQIQNPNLQRMRELVVQAGNDTLTENDRAMIQKEMDEIKNSVNDIANNTEFNTKKVLTTPSVNQSERGAGAQPIDVVFFIDDSGTMQEEIDHVHEGIESFVSDMSKYGDVKVGTVSTVHESSGERDLPLTSDVNEIKDHVSEKHVAEPGGNAMYKNLVEHSPSGSKGDDMGYRPNSKRVFVLLSDTSDETSTSMESEVKTQLDRDGVYTYTFGLNFAGTGAGETNSFTSSSSYDSFSDEIIIPETAEEIAENISPGLSAHIANDAGLGEEESLEPVKLQVGPNSGQTMHLELYDFRTKKLGINDLDITSGRNIDGALGKVDEAMKLVSTRRSQYGAYANALGHLASSVQNYHSKLTSSHSTIADADIPKEYSRLSSEQIILQTSQAMTAKFNSQQQSILEFLR